MSVGTEDVQEAVKLLWDANSTLSALQLVMGRQAELEVAPYTTFVVRDGNVEFNAGTSYLQYFDVEFRTWGDEGATAVAPIKQAVESTFLLQGRRVLSLPSGRNLQLLYSLKAPGGALDEDQNTQRGKAVVMSVDRYSMLAQG